MSTLAYQINPARCKKSLTVSEAATGNINEWVEVKEDGLRYLWQIRPNGAPHHYLTSRRISVVTKEFVEKQDKVTWLRDFRTKLRDTVLDGEICGSGISSDTQHDMVTGNVVFKVWDVLINEGEDLRQQPLNLRRQALLSLYLKHLKHDSRIRLIDTLTLGRAVVFTRQKKIEGFILKDPEAVYGEGWTKVKAEETHDVIITGVIWSESESYGSKGWIRSVLVGQYDAKGKMIDCGQVSGFTEAVRGLISATPQKFKGKVIEIECQQRLPSGKFRHPRFLRFREDKNASDCVYLPAKRNSCPE